VESEKQVRILWLHQYFATPKGWGAVRTYEFARRFVRAGHAVDVVCCAGYDDSLRKTGREPLTVDGVRVFVSGTAYRPQMGFVRRVMSFLRFMAAALWFVLRHGREYDTVIASSGPLTLAVPALVGRWLWRVPYVFEVIDVWPDSAIEAGVLRNPLLKWLSFRLEALAYRYAAAIVTCSTGMTERVLGKMPVVCDHPVVAKGSVKEKVRKSERPDVVTISNCCDLEMCAPDEAVRRAVRLKYGVREDQTVVLYSGAMGRSNAMEDVAAAVQATAEDDRIVWWFAGDGPEKGRIYCDHPVVAMGSVKSAKGGRGAHEGDEVKGREAECPGKRKFYPHLCGHWVVTKSGRNGECKKREGRAMDSQGDGVRKREDGVPRRVRWFGRLAKEEVVALVQAADVNVVTFRHEPLFFENSPNKFFDGIAAGVPALFNRSTWLEPWIKAYDCGMVCKGERPGEEMAEALRELASQPERRQQMGRNARRLAEEVFDREKLAQVYGEIIATT